MTGLIVLDHIHGRFQGLVVGRRGEGRGMFESNQNTDIEELVFANSKVAGNATFDRERERRIGRSQVDSSYEFIDPGVQQCVGWPKYSMNIGFGMTLKIYQLWNIY